jgi:branched-chain amino acid transport system ATP-binding protein
VPEDRRIFTELTVSENLEVGRQPTLGIRSQAKAWTPERLFELFPNLAEARHRLGGRLSGGEQQMLTVARTLMGNPRLILLDEPSEGVAPIIVDAMADMILELKKTGVAIVLSEQNLPFAELVSDRAYIIEKGEMRFSGTMEELRCSSETRRTYLEL